MNGKMVATETYSDRRNEKHYGNDQSDDSGNNLTGRVSVDRTSMVYFWLWLCLEKST